MTKDNFLYACIGILVGFIGGYMLHEVMVARQPPRLTPELRAQIVMSPEQGGGPMQAAPQAPPPGAAPGGGGAPMAEVQELQARLQQNPDDVEAMLRLANLNFDIRNWVRAQELYTRYLTLRPNDADVMTDLGISYRETRQFEKALEIFDKTQEIAPQHWQSYYNEVVVLAFDLKRMDEANQTLAKLRELQPDNQDVTRLVQAVAASQRNAA